MPAYSFLSSSANSTVNPCFSAQRAYMRRSIFFFQAEDGIRDTSVTGVQTCALPIFTLFSGSVSAVFRKDRLPMATQQELMTKKLPTGSSTKPISNTERRGSRRCKITQLMRIRPSDPNKDHFEDMRGSVSVSRSGVFFQSSESGYEVGMRLFVTMPYSKDPASMAREYLAEVVRRDVLPTGMFGIGIKILMEMGIQHTYHFGPGHSR